MRKRMRLPSKERRQAIVTAVKGAFAAKGFDGTTTRELARAAGVSEALLYKHFPSKESLYGAMLDACAEGPVAAEWGRVLTLPPSTSTLVVLVHLLTAHFVMLSRNLVYTAVTRARKLCVLVADPRALRVALAEIRREDRRTKLGERLQRAVRGASA